MTTPRTLLRRFGTQQQTTEVEIDEKNAHWWSRSLTSPSPTVAQDSPEFLTTGIAPLCAAASREGLVFAQPSDIRSDRFTWRVHGTRTAAESLLPKPGSTSTTFAGPGHTWKDLGRALHDFHDNSLRIPDERSTVLPPGLTRLQQWLSAQALPGPSALWRQDLRDTIGTPRWQQVHDMITTLHIASSEPPAPLLHGWFSLGNIVFPVGANRPATILTGPEICHGVREYDLGTLLGELVEYGYIAGFQGLEESAYRNAADEILDGYRHPFSYALLHAAIVIRVLVHTCDFVQNVGWSDELSLYSAILCELVDTDVQQLLNGL